MVGVQVTIGLSGLELEGCESLHDERDGGVDEASVVGVAHASHELGAEPSRRRRGHCALLLLRSAHRTDETGVALRRTQRCIGGRMASLCRWLQ